MAVGTDLQRRVTLLPVGQLQARQSGRFARHALLRGLRELQGRVGEQDAVTGICCAALVASSLCARWQLCIAKTLASATASRASTPVTAIRAASTRSLLRRSDERVNPCRRASRSVARERRRRPWRPP